MERSKKDMIAAFERICEGAYDLNESLKLQDLKEEDVVLLREKIKKSKLVPRFIHQKQLLLFVNACKTDSDRQAKWVHMYYKIKHHSPEFFKNRDVLSEEIQAALDNQIFLTLPVTPNNYIVVLHKLNNHDPKAFVFDEAIKTFIMTVEACSFRHGPRDGTVFIYDFEGGKFRHLLKPSISSVRKGIEFLQSGSPLNVKEMHIFNVPYFIDIVFSMIRPFVRKELFERIHIHHGTTYDDFFTKFIPRSHMPRDYGGDLASIAELHEENRNVLTDLRDYFFLERKQMDLELDDCADDDDDDNDEEDFFDAE